jgi:hypothetical protein
LVCAKAGAQSESASEIAQMEEADVIFWENDDCTATPPEEEFGLL